MISIWEVVKATSIVEWLAVTSSIIYVILAAKRLIICWFFALIGSILFVYLCYIGKLYIESILQFFYVIMAIIGWINWKNSKTKKIFIQKWTLNNHLINIILSGIFSIIIGYIFENYTNQENPYIDSFTTCYSLSATYMVTKKILGNWIYWIIIDLISIYLYATRGYHLTALQYLIFTFLALFGFIAWNNQYQKQKQ
ncbi:MAG: nicotinamide mononucleotide transporter pnuc [Crocinitomicaceae bacterium]|nr:nicotinamide mononucleotide transporter pnuc [Crocinitomicaceae bacterium]